MASDLMNISDINDERNGLLLFKPLEHAFDHFQISFIYNNADDCFHLKLFDPSIRNKPLIDLIQDPNHKKVLRAAVKGKKRCTFDLHTTFGDLDNKVLNVSVMKRPYKRCLNLQARLARAMARKKNAIEQTYDFDDFWSEGLAVEEIMDKFFKSTEQY
ncbi:Aste57867_9917 [Aphanomyces stellatus]|uniref:Aste57867_7212 protein n=1 Tax=Aphanomyces stellatus TaxID=120398 RepID=A0A485KGG7_9STRA|nr:hypothetical protein As57867_009878 [Aphanomyces stellatus]KAF0704883.1 hypothetical protein As57867_007198 [Aphanomyces stellatus]KAF0704901.1 hypothetical protein As57867_007187 [Aphanomyces stellatus]VFT84138.1 Aste57867_7212 [Aphanomyces stellatus]VFT84149.1 Aste57867_7223 [Aphanomyces stellatus]